MRVFAIALYLAALTLVFGMLGCASLTHSAAERAHQAQRVTDYDVMLFNEDLDYFLLQDRPSRLSKWIIR